MKKAILIAYDWPHEKGGYNISLLTCLRHYVKYFESVTVIVLCDKAANPLTEIDSVVKFHHVQIEKKSEVKAFLSSIFSIKAGVEMRYSKKYNYVVKLIASELQNETTLFIHGVLLSRLIQKIRSSIYGNYKVVLQSHDCFHIAYKGIYRQFKGVKKIAWFIEQKKLFALEALGVADADRVFPITKNDALSYEMKFFGREFKPFLRQPVFERPKNFIAGDRNTLVILGRVDARKASGISSFIKDIYPVLRQQNKELKLLLGGMGSEFFHSPEKGIFAHGYVEDEDEFIMRGRFFINPQTQGAGLQFKVLKALSAGRIVFSRELSTRGLDDRFIGVVTYHSADDILQHLEIEPSLKYIRGLMSQFSKEQFEQHHREYISSLLGNI